MKKNFHYILLFLGMMILTSCGSNSIKDPVRTTTQNEINGYYFTETDESLYIDSHKSYTIKFRLNKDGFGADKETVRFASFDAAYGTIENSTVVTDSEGRGKFIYHPPATMPAVGTSITVQYAYKVGIGSDSNTSSSRSAYLIQNITLHFNDDSGKNGEGKVSNLSISYLNTTCDAQQGIISHYNVHASDPYSREPVVGLDVEFSLVNSIKIHKKHGVIENHIPIQFSDSTVDFTRSVHTSDNLIILPTKSASNVSYVGGWKIDDVGTSLQLRGAYTNIKKTKNLTYIIGNEKRLLGGFNGNEGIPTVAHVTAVDATTDSNGFAYFDVVYDPELAGHTVTVESHGQLNGQRFGIAKTEFLRTEDFTADEIEITNNGFEGLVPMHIWIQPGCIGEVSGIDISTQPSSFKIEPAEHCAIDVSRSKYSTGSSGNVYLYVITDGNISADGNSTKGQTCKLSWEGGAHSLR